MKQIQTFQEKLEHNQFVVTIKIDSVKSNIFQLTKPILNSCALADAINVVDCPMGNVIINSLVPPKQNSFKPNLFFNFKMLKKFANATKDIDIKILPVITIAKKILKKHILTK